MHLSHDCLSRVPGRSSVTTEEAAGLIVCYFFYVLVMYFNQGMMEAIDKCVTPFARRAAPTPTLFRLGFATRPPGSEPRVPTGLPG